MSILGGTEVSLDDLASFSKLGPLLTIIANKLDEQDAAIKQLRERDAVMGKFRRQAVAALQMCVERGDGKEKLEERLLELDDVIVRLPKAEVGLAKAEARVQCLTQELDQADLQLRQRVASLEKNMELQMKRNVASLERKIEMQAAVFKEKLDATVEQSAASAEQLVTHALRRVEARLESKAHRLQLQAHADPHVKEGSAYDATDLLSEEGERGREDEHTAVSDPKAAMTAVEPTLPIGLLFPGQGSQYVTMLSSVRHLPAVSDMLRKAKLILGWDVLELCLEGPESKQAETQFCQPLMFVAGMAGLEKLRHERREAAEQFQATAGLSSGEYTALCAAGVFSFEDGLKLVDIRGKAMQEAGNKSKQTMLSVVGLDKPLLKELCRKAREAEGHTGVCQIANHLFPKGFSCAGTVRAIHFLEDMSMTAGALQAKVLKTTCAHHTPLMAPAEKVVAAALDEMLPKMNPPRHTVYMNATAEPIKPGTNPKEVVELLKRQLTSPVMWELSVLAMIESGATEFYEVGPMKQIKAMMKRIHSKVWKSTFNIEI